MVALAVSTYSRCRARIVQPSLHQLAVHHVVGCQGGFGVIPPAHHGRWFLPVQVGHAGQETVCTVRVAVTPGRYCATHRVVGDGVLFGARLAIKQGEVLWASLYGAQHTRSAGRRIGQAPVVGVRVVVAHNDVSSQAVDGTRCSFADQFSQTVSVKIIDQKLGVMGTGPDVLA